MMRSAGSEGLILGVSPPLFISAPIATPGVRCLARDYTVGSACLAAPTLAHHNSLSAIVSRKCGRP